MWEDVTFVFTVLGFTAAVALLLVELHHIATRTADRWIRFGPTGNRFSASVRNYIARSPH